MAAEVQIGGDGAQFVGEDKTYVFEVLDKVGVPLNIAGKTLQFVVSKKDASVTPVFSETATVTGSYNAMRVLNTQRASVVLTDTQLDTIKAGTMRHSLKIMDYPETVVVYGDFVTQKATAP